MTTEREFMRGERGSRTAYQERCCSRGRMRTKSGSVEEFTAPALRSSGTKPTSEQQDREIGTKLRGVSNGSPSIDELLKTRALEKMLDVGREKGKSFGKPL